MKPKKLLKQIADHPLTAGITRDWIYREFPELANKPQPFKDGELIQNQGNLLIKITDAKKGKGYGFVNYRFVDRNYTYWSFRDNPEAWKPADPEIWKQKLIEECKRRGIQDTPDIDTVLGGKIYIKGNCTPRYNEESDILWSKFGCVYGKGKFATPSIPQYTQEEAEKKFKFRMI